MSLIYIIIYNILYINIITGHNNNVYYLNIIVVK